MYESPIVYDLVMGVRIWSAIVQVPNLNVASEVFGLSQLEQLSKGWSESLNRHLTLMLYVSVFRSCSASMTSAIIVYRAFKVIAIVVNIDLTAKSGSTRSINIVGGLFVCVQTRFFLQPKVTLNGHNEQRC